MTGIKFETLSELNDKLGDNVETVSMRDLRNAHGADRLGRHVRNNISKELEGLGLAHWPDPLEADQWASVRIYRRGTPAADIIRAVFTPGEKGDETLNRVAVSDAEQTLMRVRELVCS